MSITDELRKSMNPCVSTDWLTIPGSQFESIADRIDAAHERTFRNLTDALHKQEDATRELDEKSVLLPVDADGEVIHIGDRVENNERVVRIVLTDGSCEPSVYIEKRPNVLHEHFCNEISHYHAPTVEDVLTKMLEQAVGYSDAHTTVAANAIVEYAAKLRLAGLPELRTEGGGVDGRESDKDCEDYEKR